MPQVLLQSYYVGYSYVIIFVSITQKIVLATKYPTIQHSLDIRMAQV